MNYFIEEVFSNEPLVATGVAWFLAQLLKTFTSTIREGKFDFKWFVIFVLISMIYIKIESEV